MFIYKNEHNIVEKKKGKKKRKPYSKSTVEIALEQSGMPDIINDEGMTSLRKMQDRYSITPVSI